MDVHGVEVGQEPVRVMEHGVAMPQPVNVCDIQLYIWTIVFVIFGIIYN